MKLVTFAGATGVSAPGVLAKEVRQHGSTAEMVFSVAEIVAFASRFMTLEPGDVIATGTPAGTGKATGRLLKPGDLMEAEISGIGILRTPVVGP